MAIRRSLAFVALAALVVVLAACGGDSPGVPTAAEAGGGPAATAGGPAERETGPKVVTYENVTFQVPQNWRIDIRGGVAGLGDFVPRPGRMAGPSLVVSVSSAGPIDSSVPTRCERGPASSVDLVQAGFAPVGERTAEFRFWIATCDDGTTEEKRAWLLPGSRISFIEQYHVDANVDVVATAVVT
ncbi:MAG: hypothetical protein ABR540_15325 [Acidimicrobiales bacterium]